MVAPEDGQFTYGIPGAGCLEPKDPLLAGVHVSGTSAVPYEIDPATTEIAADDSYDGPVCDVEPAIGPVPIEAAEGQRVYVIAWSPTEDVADRELLVLPVEVTAAP